MIYKNISKYFNNARSTNSNLHSQHHCMTVDVSVRYANISMSTVSRFACAVTLDRLGLRYQMEICSFGVFDVLGFQVGRGKRRIV